MRSNTSFKNLEGLSNGDLKAKANQAMS